MTNTHASLTWQAFEGPLDLRLFKTKVWGATLPLNAVRQLHVILWREADRPGWGWEVHLEDTKTGDDWYEAGGWAEHFATAKAQATEATYRLADGLAWSGRNR